MVASQENLTRSIPALVNGKRGALLNGIKDSLTKPFVALLQSDARRVGLKVENNASRVKVGRSVVCADRPSRRDAKRP